MNQKGEYILVAITVILIAVSGIVFFDSALRSRVSEHSDTAPSAINETADRNIIPVTSAAGTVKVTIDFGNGTVIEDTRDTSQPIDARDVVYLAAVSNKFPVRAGERFLPVAIGETENEMSGRRWALYINGKSTDSLERVSVQSGDVLMLKYE